MDGDAIPGDEAVLGGASDTPLRVTSRVERQEMPVARPAQPPVAPIRSPIAQGDPMPRAMPEKMSPSVLRSAKPRTAIGTGEVAIGPVAGGSKTGRAASTPAVRKSAAPTRSPRSFGQAGGQQRSETRREPSRAEPEGRPCREPQQPAPGGIGQAGGQRQGERAGGRISRRNGMRRSVRPFAWREARRAIRCYRQRGRERKRRLPARRGGGGTA